MVILVVVDVVTSTEQAQMAFDLKTSRENDIKNKFIIWHDMHLSGQLSALVPSKGGFAFKLPRCLYQIAGGEGKTLIEETVDTHICC